MNWFLLLAVPSVFLLGWACGLWQCSKRGECPRYRSRALEKWKKSLVRKR